MVACLLDMEDSGQESDSEADLPDLEITNLKQAVQGLQFVFVLFSNPTADNDLPYTFHFVLYIKDDIPLYLHEDFIVSGYRAHFRPVAALKSLFRLHNGQKNTDTFPAYTFKKRGTYGLTWWDFYFFLVL